jgi:hypothetical protein
MRGNYYVDEIVWFQSLDSYFKEYYHEMQKQKNNPKTNTADATI